MFLVSVKTCSVKGHPIKTPRNQWSKVTGEQSFLVEYVDISRPHQKPKEMKCNWRVPTCNTQIRQKFWGTEDKLIQITLDS